MAELTPLTKLRQKLAIINGAADYEASNIIDELPTGASTIHVARGQAWKANWEDRPDNGEVFDIDANLALYTQMVKVNYDALVANKLNEEHAMKAAILRVEAARLFGVNTLPTDETVAANCYKPEIAWFNLETKTKRVKKSRTIEKKVHHAATAEVQAYDEIVPTVETYEVDEEVPTILQDEAFVNRVLAVDPEAVIALTYHGIFWMHLQFMKTEHHFRNDAMTQQTYEKHFRSCRFNHLISGWCNFNVIYNAFHWMGPYNMKQVVALILPHLERGARVKWPPTPAGTAYLVSGVAVLKAARSWPGVTEYLKSQEEPWEELQDAARAVTSDYYRYHTRCDLFGFPQDIMLNRIREASENMDRFATLAQAFLNVLCRNSDLGGVQSIKKHAESTMGMLKRYEMLFKASERRVRADAYKLPATKMFTGEQDPKMIESSPVPVVEEID